MLAELSLSCRGGHSSLILPLLTSVSQALLLRALLHSHWLFSKIRNITPSFFIFSCHSNCAPSSLLASVSPCLGSLSHALPICSLSVLEHLWFLALKLAWMPSLPFPPFWYTLKIHNSVLASVEKGTSYLGLYLVTRPGVFLQGRKSS